MYVLGVWDGHDSGAALIEDNKIVYAANEERFTRRKLEVRFPSNSIAAALRYAGLRPADIEAVSFPTTELTKTISRVFPSQKERYYMFRRRKMLRPRLESLMHYAKYGMTSIGVLPGCREISRAAVSRELRHLGFGDFRLYDVDHHESHAATAAFTSGYKDVLVVTLDGLGDGLSGSVSTLENGELRRRSAIGARDSIGIFYEQVTNILGMRELEDEGKVMAMADFSYPFDLEDNKLRDFFRVEDSKIIAKYGPIAQYDMLNRIAWGTPKEQFAYMAQQLLESVFWKFFSNLHKKYGFDNLALAGGIFSNVKANMAIRERSGFKRIYVFPHMGDGGIALGSAMQTGYSLSGTSSYAFSDSYLGDSYSDADIEEALRKEKWLHFQKSKDKGRHAAELLGKNNYVFWFQGRFEYGPRALGNRSIIAKADSDDVKDRLNLYVKQREWFQPFAPSVLDEDAPRLMEGIRDRNKFMTMAYRIKDDKRHLMKSVMHVDFTARPQMVGEENKNYRDMLLSVRKTNGYGVVLNTSFNIHGQPIVSSPGDAIETMRKTRTRYMFIGDYFVESKKA